MTEPDKRRRPWWKLHFSTKVVIAVVVIGLIFANVPAREMTYVEIPDDGKYGPHYEPYTRYEHGWPSSYLTRNIWISWGLRSNSWGITQNVQSFSVSGIAIDSLVAAVVVTCAAAIFESWRRRRQSLWRFRLIELFGVLTTVAVAGGWYQWQSRIANLEAAALQEAHLDYLKQYPDESKYPFDDVTYERGGPTFLRELLGDKPFTFQDRVVHADIIDSNPKFANQFPYLQCIRPGADGIETDAARSISKLRRLETLDVFMSGLGPLTEHPPLKSLRGINLFDGGVTERDLVWIGECTNLEQLEMSRVNIGDEGLRHLIGLKKLKALSVGGGYGEPEFSDDCFESLACLDSLEELWLSGEFRGDKIESLLQLRRLKSLYLSSQNFSPANLKRLEKFGHLKRLSVPASGISDPDIAKLQAAIPNCEVD